MASTKSVFFAIFLFLATTCAAPSNDGNEVLKTPLECVGQQFCSIRPEGYDELEQKMNSLLPEYLLKEYADRSGSESDARVDKLSDESDWHNCPYQVKTEPWFTYYRGPNNTKTEIIVQTKLFKQRIESVVCSAKNIDADSSVQCFKDLVSESFGLRSKCVTSYATRTLYVFNPDSNELVQKQFKVPACCKCRVFD